MKTLLLLTLWCLLLVLCWPLAVLALLAWPLLWLLCLPLRLLGLTLEAAFALLRARGPVLKDGGPGMAWPSGWCGPQARDQPACCCAIQRSTRRSSRSIGMPPPPSTASWKPRMSNFSPSASSAFRRSCWIRIMPIL